MHMRRNRSADCSTSRGRAIGGILQLEVRYGARCGLRHRYLVREWARYGANKPVALVHHRTTGGRDGEEVK